MRSCSVLGTKKMVGNNVSHANNRTRRVFLPNLRTYEFESASIGIKVSLLLSQKGRKTIERCGSIDAFLLETRNGKLTSELLKLKKIVKSKLCVEKA